MTTTPTFPPGRSASWKRGLIILLVAIAMIASVAMLWRLYQKSQSSTTDERHSVESALRQLRQVDAEMNLAVLRAKLGYSNSYDPLVALVNSSASLQAELAQLPGMALPGMQDTLRLLEKAFADKTELVEQFKSHNAVARNSLRYLPLAAAEALRNAKAPGPANKTNDLSASIADVEILVLRHASLDDPTQSAEMTTAIARLTALAATRPANDTATSSLNNYLHHTTIFLAQRGAEDDLIAAITKVPTATQIDSVWSAYEALAALRNRDAVFWRTALALHLSAMLLLLVLFSLRLRKSYRVINRVNHELTSLNETLEARVTERTASLEASQAQLHAALDQKETMLVKERELGELKTRFVSMASHEFRTPLTTIQLASDLLLHYADRLPPDERKASLVSIQTALARMVSGMENILNLGKLDEAAYAYKPVALDLHKLLLALVAEVTAATGGSHRIDLTPPADTHNGTPLLDEALMRQIVGNLLSNACKYSPPGTTVQLLWQREADQLRLSVSDQGMGIPEADLQRLFETFHRASNVGSIQGTGLGLAIVKRAIDRMGGRIEVASTVGVGTRFLVNLPWQE